MKGVVSGKHYNRSLFCHKIMPEALQRLRLELFLNTLNDDSVDNIYLCIMSIRDSIFGKGMQSFVKSQLFDDIVHLYEHFIAKTSLKSLREHVSENDRQDLTGKTK